MAHFSNGTEGDIYQDRYCFRCEHWPEEDDRNCPIWAAHQFYNGEQFKNDAVKSILSMLIPEKPHTFKDGLTYNVAAECSFFRQKQERLPLC